MTLSRLTKNHEFKLEKNYNLHGHTNFTKISFLDEKLVTLIEKFKVWKNAKK